MHLIVGKDNTAKSTLAARIANKFANRTEEKGKILYIDWDGTAKMAIEKIYDISVFMPSIVFDDKLKLDYMEKLVSTMSAIQEGYYNTIVFDGFSNFIGDCELLMRLDHTIEIDDTVRFRYWTTRNQFVINLLDLAARQCVNLVVVGHSDLILPTDLDKVSKLTIRLNAKTHNRFETIQGTNKEGHIVFAFKATKAKYAIFMTDETVGILKVKKDEKKIEILGDDHIDTLLNL